MYTDQTDNSPPNQQQSLGDVQVQGHDNIFNAIQAKVVTLTQNKIIQVSVDEIKTRPFRITSPYKGLKSFEPEDKDQFFGRDQFIAGIVNELEQTNLILLLGASGSGKSSVIRAGLVPWLVQQWGTRLVPLTLTPDQDPFDSLYASLLNRFKQSEAQGARAGQANTLSQLVKQLKQPDSFWFIFIDQFEELFTISDPDKRDRFITSLVNLCKDYAADPTVKIVATMRADFLGRLDAEPANRLARLTEKHRPLMTRMHADELRLAIEQPAAHHGVVFEQGLVETIIKDLQGQAGYLPLLQYLLDQLWESEVRDGGIHDRTLNIGSYRQLGGVRGALQKRVSQIYQGLSAPEQQAAQRIFLKLVGIGGNTATETDWQPVRKRELRSHFTDPLEQDVLVRLIDENLLVSDTADVASEATVEIAHEILLTSWKALQGWIQENRQNIALRNRLNDDAALWHSQKDSHDLWSGSRLEQALELRGDDTFEQILGGFSPLANAFIAASEKHYKQKQRRRRRRRLLITSGLTAGLVVTSSLAGLAWWQSQRTALSELDTIVKSSQLFSDSNNSLEALIQAVKAKTKLTHLFNADRKIQAEADSALWESVYGLVEINRLEGHTDWVWDVEFSPDNALVATTSLDTTIRLWRSDGSLLKVLDEHSANVKDITFSEDGQTMASASDDGTVILWNRDGELLQRLPTDNEYVFTVALGPEGQLIAAAGSDNLIQLWNRDGTLLRTLEGHQAPVQAVEISPDGQTIASVSEDGILKLWAADGTLQRTITAHGAEAFDITFSPDGQTLATAGGDRTVKLWSLAGERLKTYAEHQGRVYKVTFSSDGQMLASVGGDRVARVWRPDGLTLATLVGHEEEVWGVAFSSDDKVLATTSGDRTVKFWKLYNPLFLTLKRHTNEIWGVTFSPDGETIASVDRDRTINLWSSKGAFIKRLGNPEESHSAEIRSVAFSPDSRRLASASWDGTAKVWSFEGALLATLNHDDRVNDVAFSPDGQTIATASSDGTIKLWSGSGEFLRVLEQQPSPVYSVAFSPSGDRIAAASYNGQAKLWSRDGALIATLDSHTRAIGEITFSADGERLATASWDNTVKLWSKDGELLQTLEGHSDGVSGVAFSPDGQWIASASWDKTIKLWDQAGRVQRTFTNHSARVASVDFSPDSEAIVSAGLDRTIILWNFKQMMAIDPVTYGCRWIKDYLQNNPSVEKSDQSIC